MNPIDAQLKYKRRSLSTYSSTAGRRKLRTAVMSVMCLIAMTGLVVFTSLDVMKARQSVVEMRLMQTSVEQSIEVANLVHTLQIERGTRVLYVSSSGDQSVEKALQQAQTETDKAATELQLWPSDFRSLRFHNRDTFQEYLNTHRRSHQYNNTTVVKEITFYTDIISNLFDWLFRQQSSHHQSDFDVLQEFNGYRMFLIGKEKTGIERALGGSFFAKGYFFKTSDLLWYAEQYFLGRNYLKTSMLFMPQIKDTYDKVVKERNSSILSILGKKRQVILDNKRMNASSNSGSQWFNLMTIYIDALLQVQSETGTLVLDKIKGKVTQSENEWILKVAIFGFIVLLMPSCVYSIHTIQGYAAQLQKISKDLKEEKQRADSLLYQMLPLPVAEQLKHGQSVTAEQYESVTVFFSDIVDFTQICANISPMEVTRMLNRLYGIFDNHVDKYDVYKVETIGDAYMVVSGLPERNGRDHVSQIADMALHLVELMESFRFGSDNERDLCVRIGIHTGRLIGRRDKCALYTRHNNSILFA